MIFSVNSETLRITRKRRLCCHSLRQYDISKHTRTRRKARFSWVLRSCCLAISPYKQWQTQAAVKRFATEIDRAPRRIKRLARTPGDSSQTTSIGLERLAGAIDGRLWRVQPLEPSRSRKAAARGRRCSATAPALESPPPPNRCSQRGPQSRPAAFRSPPALPRAAAPPLRPAPTATGIRTAPDCPAPTPSGRRVRRTRGA